MHIILDERTEETVRIYFEQAQRQNIKRMLPQKAQSVEEAVADYKATLLPAATSYGRTIRADGRYVGDVWCYCIDRTESPNAMLSYCVFDEACWGRGVATQAVSLFLREVRERYGIKTVGAFTFSNNLASIRVLEKNGFVLVEALTEEGRESKYFQRPL
jgi:RimJ/RimL family protein N-acetyltransferase